MFFKYSLFVFCLLLAACSEDGALKEPEQTVTPPTSTNPPETDEPSGSTADPEIVYGDYEFSLVERVGGEKVDMISFPAGETVYVYALSMRRQVLEDGAFNGKYDNVPVGELDIQSTDSHFIVADKYSDGNKLNFSVVAEENEDWKSGKNAVLRISTNGKDVSVPMKQEKAVLTIQDDYFIIHPNQGGSVVYLDNKGAVANFKCALASHYFINGKPAAGYWCDEECEFEYNLIETEWIKAGGTVSEKEGLYSLPIESVRDAANGDHETRLVLTFTTKDSRVFQKEITLISTQVYNITEPE
ncbi:hypothetical protein [Parabacteroides merdae]|uniref:hypothetical protein n=1 Tax=Parabacteroides merdae TaxID=46503 RepID=UPI0034A13A93